MSERIKTLCYGGLFIALTALGTMVIHIPVPATNGYIHIGDSVILLIAYFFGMKYGVISASIGSALADILTGYMHWALFTLIIKALMAFVVVKLCDRAKPVVSLQNMTAVVLSEAVMILGYFLGGVVLYGGVLASLQSVPANLVQAGGGIVIFGVVAAAFKKSGIVNRIRI